ncbi:MAG: trypsin-like peptidase domain-containing protein [Lachnospiraceae bacterium]|nr:trypsin-like peptidase domain-containing protein [Lachnospiraceae bacterium]
MDKEYNNMNQESGSTYHFGRNESPFGREDISGRDTSKDQHSANAGSDENRYQQSGQADHTDAKQSGNPYSQGSVYGQGIYTGNDFGNQQQPPKKKKKEKKTSNGRAKKVGALLASAAVFGLVAGGVMVGVNTVGNKMLGNSTKTKEIATVATTDSVLKDEDGNGGGVANVAEEVMPSIVSITNTSVQIVRSWFQSYEQEVSGSGSGIIIGQTDDEIMIATNNHVIEGAKEITIAFCDESAVAATVKGADASADLAVLTVNTKDMSSDTLSKIKVAAIGSSEELRVGEAAIAIGNALGYGQSVTVGYISALNRVVDVENTKMEVLQTDAAINPGNSGGALLNAKGEVIGINTVKYVDSQVEGMGYAIPISKAIPIINDLMKQEVIEESEQGYLGIQGKDITDEYAEGFNMPNGVYIVKIVENSPADKCGLKAGDIITKFDNRDIASQETLNNILSNRKAGEEVELTVQRNNAKGEYEEVTLKVTLGAKKDKPKSGDSSDETEKEDGTQDEMMPPDVMPYDEFDLYDFFNN